MMEVREYEEIRALNVFVREYNEFIKIFNEEFKTLCNYNIIIDRKKIQNIHERFMHAVSCKEGKLKHKDYPPCVNELSAEVCMTNCDLSKANFIFKSINRVECLYRLSRIHWVKQIIDMANNGDERVAVWRYEKKDKTNGKYAWKWYVRYKEKNKDFLIVFKEEKDIKGEMVLNFRTAYPVYLPGDKKKLEKEYSRAKKDGDVIINKKPAFV